MPASPWEISVAADSLVTALERLQMTLSDYSWPVDIQGDVHNLILRLATVIDDLQTLANQEVGSPTSWSQTFVADSLAARIASNQVRQDLGLRPTPTVLQ